MKDNAASLEPSSLAPAGQRDVIVRPRQDDLCARGKGRGPRGVWRGRRAGPESTPTRSLLFLRRGRQVSVPAAGPSAMQGCRSVTTMAVTVTPTGDKTATKTGEEDAASLSSRSLSLE